MYVYPANTVRSSIQSEVKAHIGEMIEYQVVSETTVYFSLWEFRAVIQTAELLGSTVQLEFAQGGDPLFLRLEPNETLRAEFILATTGEPHIQPAARKRPAGRETRRSSTRVAPVGSVPRTELPQEVPLQRTEELNPPTPFPQAHAQSQVASVPTQPVKYDPDDSEEDLLPVRVVRPKTEPLVLSDVAPAPSPQATVAPTPAEASGSRDEHPSTLFQESLDHSPPLPDSDSEEIPATQSTQPTKKRVRVALPF